LIGRSGGCHNGLLGVRGLVDHQFAQETDANGRGRVV
jgi:hypothetical protein